MVEYRWFAVRIMMVYVTVSEILVLPVILAAILDLWYTSMSYDTAVPLLKSVIPKM